MTWGRDPGRKGGSPAVAGAEDVERCSEHGTREVRAGAQQSRPHALPSATVHRRCPPARRAAGGGAGPQKRVEAVLTSPLPTATGQAARPSRSPDPTTFPSSFHLWTSLGYSQPGAASVPKQILNKSISSHFLSSWYFRLRSTSIISRSRPSLPPCPPPRRLRGAGQTRCVYKGRDVLLK